MADFHDFLPGGKMDIIRMVAHYATQYEETFGRRLGITGELAEAIACITLRLERAPEGAKGYDAIGTNGERIQIKSRRLRGGDPVSWMVPDIRGDSYDVAMLVILNKNYGLEAIYTMSKGQFRACCMCSGRMHGRTFIASAECIYREERANASL